MRRIHSAAVSSKGTKQITAEIEMDAYTADFSLDVQGVKGSCPAGELYAKNQIAKKTIPVLSCEGPCIRGEIARLAANLMLKKSRRSRAPAMQKRSSFRTRRWPHGSKAPRRAS